VHHNPFKRSLTNEPQEHYVETEEKKSISNDEVAGTSNE